MINVCSLCPSVGALVGTWVLQGSASAFLFTQKLIKRCRNGSHLCPGALQALCCWAACLKWSYFKREAVKLAHVKMILKKKKQKKQQLA